MASIFVNGEKRVVALPQSVEDIIKKENIQQPEMVSVQLNETFVEKEDWASSQLQEGDRLDFLFFMGGGSMK